jgi:hypothetical protein
MLLQSVQANAQFCKSFVPLNYRGMICSTENGIEENFSEHLQYSQILFALVATCCLIQCKVNLLINTKIVGEDANNGNRLIVNELPLLASSPTTSPDY